MGGIPAAPWQHHRDLGDRERISRNEPRQADGHQGCRGIRRRAPARRDPACRECGDAFTHHARLRHLLQGTACRCASGAGGARMGRAFHPQAHGCLLESAHRDSGRQTDDTRRVRSHGPTDGGAHRIRRNRPLDIRALPPDVLGEPFEGCSVRLGDRLGRRP